MAEKILCVDDDKTFRMMLLLLLKQAGYEIKEANNGAEGVAVAREWTPDLILMDLMMPVMNGFEATRRLRAMPQTSKTPILVLSAYGDEDVLRDAASAGATTHILKTSTPDNLLEEIKNYLTTKNK